MGSKAHTGTKLSQCFYLHAHLRIGWHPVGGLRRPQEQAMKKNLPLLTTTLLLSSSSLIGFGQEKTLSRSQLPPAVEKTVQAQSQGATIKRFVTERENGKTVYEAEMTVDGHTKDIQIAKDGTLNEIEEEVAIDSLPPEVQAALRKKQQAQSSPRWNP
ncbi:hypothetical protein RBB78_24030 [Tunturiibacter empetritectus]|uniref:PepSY domain-containing protein n=1 Tax=Tunturiibacter empetritectus TaxID=3069691 RepID=UPI003D9B75AB